MAFRARARGTTLATEVWQTGCGPDPEPYPHPGGFEAVGHIGSAAGYFSFVRNFPDLGVTTALSVDAMLDATPVLAAAMTVRAPQDP